MQIRCPKCQSAIWLDTNRRTGGRCSACSQEYDFGDRLRGHRLGDLHRKARAYAVEHSLDLPSAFSVLLGITTLSDVRDFVGSSTQARPAVRVTTSAPVEAFDPGFRSAVEAGMLTAEQAAGRGNRESYARRLIARHQISLADAYAVADNRVSLLSAMRKRAASASIHIEAAGSSRVGRLAALGMVAAVVLLAGLAIARRAGGEASPTDGAGVVRPEAEVVSSTGARTGTGVDRPTPPPPAEVTRGENGEPVYISASRPEIVLRAYCEQPGREPFALGTGAVPDPSLWLGLYRDLSDLGVSRAIAIRRDHTTGRWTTGYGTSPIAVLTPAPEQLGTLHDLPVR